MSTNPRKKRSRPKELGVVNFVDHSIAIAKQINIILDRLGKTQADLARALDKEESEVSKWMHGTHNFTLLTISKIEEALGESVIVCPKDVDNRFTVMKFSPVQFALVKTIEGSINSDIVKSEVKYINFTSTGDTMILGDCSSVLN